MSCKLDVAFWYAVEVGGDVVVVVVVVVIVVVEIVGLLQSLATMDLRPMRDVMICLTNSSVCG